jgi:ketosteroid isomerase-like protein
MFRTFSLGFVVAFVLVFTASCSDDDTIVSPKSSYEDLTIRDHVLVNFELAVVERNLERYGDLFDADFVFRFSASEVATGSVRTSSWDRESELAAASHLFDPGYTQPGVLPVLWAKFELAYASGDDEWTEVTAAGAWRADGETRYRKKVTYGFQVHTEYIDYVCTQIEAVVVVKPVSIGSATQWRIVEWQDDTGSGMRLNASQSAGTEMTWGKLKDIYCGDCCYRDLTERDQALENLKHAWNDRNLERYDELLDDDFVFLFSNTDYEQGIVPYQQWGRAADIGAARNVFDPNFSKPGMYPVSAVDLSLFYAPGDDEWIEVPPADPVEYPDETWYEKTVTYSLAVKAWQKKFIGYNIRATFTVRRATGAGDREYWRIVLWRDDTGAVLRAAPDGMTRSPLSENTTWGELKARYSE